MLRAITTSKRRSCASIISLAPGGASGNHTPHIKSTASSLRSTLHFLTPISTWYTARYLRWTRLILINYIPSWTSFTVIEGPSFLSPLNIVFSMHHLHKSTDGIGATLPLSRSSDYMDPSSYFTLEVRGNGRKERSKASRHVYRHSPLIYSQV